MLAPIIFASFIMLLLLAPMLRLLGIAWLWSFVTAALLSAAVGYSALSTAGAL